MCRSARLFNCCRCQAQVILCSYCDRGQRYCTRECAEAARSDSLKRAGKKYQSTRPGRFHNADRQKRFRERQKQIVTHQGSQAMAGDDVLKEHPIRPKKLTQPQPWNGECRCHACGARCEPFLRSNFLHQHRFETHILNRST